MGRSESKQVVNQSLAQSSQDQAAATSANAATNSYLADYNTNLKNYLSNDPYTSPEHKTAEKQMAGDVSAGTAASTSEELKNYATRTGTGGSPQYAAAGEEMQRQRQRDMTSYLTQLDQADIAASDSRKQFGVTASQFPVSTQTSLYGTSLGGSNAAMGNAASAAKTPGFWDTFLPALAQGAGAAIGGFGAGCPCKGSLIRMADGSDKLVEELTAGDYLWALSMSGPPNKLLETPKPVKSRSYEIVTSNGRRHWGSATHTVALAIGGYGYMPELSGQVVIAELGTDLVEKVNEIGEQEVYPLLLDGSHTYMADGIWIIS